MVHKNVHFHFLNSFVKHWLILIIFRIKNYEKTWFKWL